MKEALAYPVRGAMEDRTVRIPYDPKVRADLRQVTKVVTPAGNIRFTAERTPDGHADHFWALALAKHAASSPSAPIEFMSGGPRESARDMSDFING
jgi:phage FluMu gp28-like protein